MPENDEEIILTVQSLDSELDPNLIIKRGLTELPTVDYYDIISNSSMTDILVLTNESFGVPDLSGYYIVGVYSENTKGKYQLTFNAGN